MKAVILAGGFGTRIQPLSYSLPKPMLPVVNRPIMEHVIERLKDAKVEEIIVLLYHQPEVIKGYFGDGSGFGVKINYVEQEEDYGTAGAVKRAERYLNETFIVISGDIITDFSLLELVDFHREKGARFTLGLYSVPNPLQFGVVITDKEGKILKFLEKPGWGEVFSDTINTGIYVVEPEVLSYIPEGSFFDFAKDLFPKLMKEGVELWGKKLSGYWKDVGNVDAYREVHRDIFSGKVRVKIPGKAERVGEGLLYREEGTEVPQDLRVEGTVVVGKGVKIGKGVFLMDTVVGDNSEIGDGSKVEDSVLWSNVKLGEKVSLRNAVVCSRVRIGNNVVAESGVVVSDETEVGERVHFVKDVVIWPKKYIEKGSVVSKNIVWGSRWEKGIFKGNKVVGSVNVELTPDTATKLGEALGSYLPKGSTVLIGRDYHRAPRTIKRAFIGGLLSTGVNAIDLHLCPLPVMRFHLKENRNYNFGVYFSLLEENPTMVEISFYDAYGLPIDTETQNKIERVFFRETYRFERFSELGIIKEDPYYQESYIRKALERIDGDRVGISRFKVVYDLLYSPASLVVPEILGNLGIESILVDAVIDERKLENIALYRTKAYERVGRIVKALEYDVGFVLYPSGERLTLITKEGEAVYGDRLLLLVLLLIDMSVGRKVKVYLPTWVPEVIDPLLRNVVVERGKITNLKPSLLEEFYLTCDANFGIAFTEHSFSPDGIYASIKILEMASHVSKDLKELLHLIPPYVFLHKEYGCEPQLKGKVMRAFAEYAADKEASFVDGVKVYEDKSSWVLVLPDPVKDTVHIYVFGVDKDKAYNHLKDYEKRLKEILEK